PRPAISRWWSWSRSADSVVASAPGGAMARVEELRTPRLLLRDWCDDDLDPFAALNAHPEVMRHFPAPLSRSQSDALAARIRTELAERGFGLWALESPGEAPFLGFVGLATPGFEAPFTPCVEVGWRLAWRFWGRGYATEAARAVLEHAFGGLRPLRGVLLPHAPDPRIAALT